MLFSKKRVLNKALNSKEGISDTLELLHDLQVISVEASVNFSHPNAGDVSIELTNPQGKSAILHAASKGPLANIQKTFSGDKLAPLTGATAKGAWKIKVNDGGNKLDGKLLDWSLSFNLKDAAKSEIIISDLDTIVSTQHCHQEGQVNSTILSLHIKHDFVGDLIVDLVAPSGKSITVHNRENGAAKEIKTTYSPEKFSAFTGESAKGNWSLKIKDSNKKDNGQLVSWKLNLQTGKIKSTEDDLTKIEGIGPKICSLLNDAGIMTFEELAATKPEKIKTILDAAGPKFQMANPGSWPKQASLAAKGDWAALSKLQDELDGGV